jgi:hypothetical protein
MTNCGNGMRIFALVTTQRSMPEDTEIWIKLIDYARWSASPHNVQPWRMKLISNTDAHLYIDHNRLLKETDPTSCFTILGMSMFIEALNIAAHPMGYEVVAKYEPSDRIDYSATEPKLFAELQLIESHISEYLEPELLKQRKTSRLPYNGKGIAQNIADSIAEVAGRYGHTFTYSGEESMLRFILDLNRETLFLDLDNDAARTELGQWIRVNRSNAKKHKDGLWSYCIRFPGWLMNVYFFHHNRLRNPLLRKILGAIYLRSMRGTASVAWISGKFSSKADWLQAGIMFQHLWLEMTKHNVYLHPFGSVITNTIAREKFIRKIQFDEHDLKLWLIIRLGYSTEPPRSFRLTTDDILLTQI